MEELPTFAQLGAMRAQEAGLSEDNQDLYAVFEELTRQVPDVFSENRIQKLGEKANWELEDDSDSAEELPEILFMAYMMSDNVELEPFLTQEVGLTAEQAKEFVEKRK